jgi:RNA polymerase sigma factor (sigma-70 family)
LCARLGSQRQLSRTRTHVTRSAPPLFLAASPRSSQERDAGVQSERELFELVYQRMRAIAYPAPDLDDLTQLAAEQVLRSLPSFDGRSEIETWVCGVCYRVLMSQRRWYWRFRKRFVSDAAAVDNQADTAARSAHELLETEQGLRLLYQALGKLNDKYRVALTLYYLEEMTSRQIAQITQTSELTVRSRLRDGRKRLLKLLGRDASAIFVGVFP